MNVPTDKPYLTAGLETFDPEAAAAAAPTLSEARTYCRDLARGHYENFTVATWLLPRRLRPHFHAIYAYCRWADDLADEIPDDGQSLALLDWWQGQLERCYTGRARHPVFVALAETVRQFEIPAEPLSDLLVAFRRDRRQHRYATIDELLDYCRYSANPVGRLVLYLGRCHTPDSAVLSDSICTGLQLANFCQDVARDFERDRIYVPQETLDAFGCGLETFSRRDATGPFRRALAHLVDRAESFLTTGRPLVERVAPELAVEVDCFLGGGLAVLEAIRRVDYDVWRTRPVVSRAARLRLLAGAWWRRRVLAYRDRPGPGT